MATQATTSTVSAGLAEYPADIDARIAAAWPNVRALDANALAERAGTVRTVNVVMPGAVAATLSFTAEPMEALIRRSVPAKTVDLSLEAFRLGRMVTRDPERHAGCREAGRERRSRPAVSLGGADFLPKAT